MKTFPLQSLTLAQAQQKQFALVDTLCRHFPGADFLAGGDFGLTPGLNQPRVTQRVETVLAEAFHAEAAVLVQGAGTGAIRAGLAALLKPGQRLLVHDAPVYPTTQVIIEQMGITWSGLISTVPRQSCGLLRSIALMPRWYSIRGSNRRTITF